MEESNSGPPKTSSDREEDSNPGPQGYKSSALPLGHAHLPSLRRGKDEEGRGDGGETVPGGGKGYDVRERDKGFLCDV